MEKISIINLTNDTVLIDDGYLADTFLTRLRGLLGKKSLLPNQGIVIKPCNSVHTIGMRFPIDVIFIDKNNKVCHIIKNMHPGKFSTVIKEANYVIEVSEGTSSRINIGDIIEVKEFKKIKV